MSALSYYQCALCYAWKPMTEMRVEHVPWQTLGRWVCLPCAAEHDEKTVTMALEGLDNEAAAQERYEHEQACFFCQRWSREGFRFLGGLRAECERRRRAAEARRAAVP